MLPLSEACFPMVWVMVGTTLALLASHAILKWTRRGAGPGRGPLVTDRAATLTTTLVLLSASVWSWTAVSPALDLHPLTHGLIAFALPTTSLGVAWAILRRRPPEPAADPGRSPIAMGAVLACSFGALLIGGDLVTDISAGDPRAIPRTQAERRLQLAPRDPEAMLSMAWHDRDADELERALARISHARELGADEIQALSAESEIRAAQGDCIAARAAFDRALRTHAERALEAALAEELTLGGYSLPPTLVSRCGVTDETATPPDELSAP